MSAVLVIVALWFASYRVTRFVVDDSLLDKPREWWFGRFPPESTLRGKLLECSYCVGWWVSGGMLAVAHLVGLANWPLRYDLVLWWAVAGGQAMLNALDARANG